MYKIGELSKLCRLPVKTLRFYDSEGLLVPDEIDRFTGYRYYSAARLADCNRIVALKELGFSLGEIKEQLQASESASILALISAKRAELDAQSKQIGIQLKRLDSIMQNITEGEKTMFDVVITGTDVFEIAFTRKLFKSKEEAYTELSRIRELVPKNIQGKRSVIVNNETEYKASDLDLAVGIEITGKLPDKLGLMTASLSDPNCAKLICKAVELEDAYQALIKQLNSLGYQITGAFTEIYHDDSIVELKTPVCRLVKCKEEAAVIKPFENDSDVIGKWQLIDIVPSSEQFLYGCPKATCINNVTFKELYFLQGGEKYWIVDGWTKGLLYTSAEFPTRHPVANSYTVREVSGHSVLFVEMTHIDKDGMTCEKPEVWVYEKVSGEAYTADDIKICDNIDYPFICDTSVIGKWTASDFYPTISADFNPDKQNRDPLKLYLRSVEFTADGKCAYTTKERSYTLVWTKGLVLSKYSQTACAYKIVTNGGKDCLLLEWKSGDYSFSGKIHRYVLVRA